MLFRETEKKKNAVKMTKRHKKNKSNRAMCKVFWDFGWRMKNKKYKSKNANKNTFKMA